MVSLPKPPLRTKLATKVSMISSTQLTERCTQAGVVLVPSPRPRPRPCPSACRLVVALLACARPLRRRWFGSWPGLGRRLVSPPVASRRLAVCGGVRLARFGLVVRPSSLRFGLSRLAVCRLRPVGLIRRPSVVSSSRSGSGPVGSVGRRRLFARFVFVSRRLVSLRLGSLRVVSRRRASSGWLAGGGSWSSRGRGGFIRCRKWF